MLNRVGMTNNPVSFKAMKVSVREDEHNLLYKIADKDNYRPKISRSSIIQDSRTNEYYYKIFVKPENETTMEKLKAIEAEKLLEPAYTLAGAKVECDIYGDREKLMKKLSLSDRIAIINDAYARLSLQKNSNRRSEGGHLC